jgi:hypothetical protein
VLPIPIGAFPEGHGIVIVAPVGKQYVLPDFVKSVGNPAIVDAAVDTITHAPGGSDTKLPHLTEIGVDMGIEFPIPV